MDTTGSYNSPSTHCQRAQTYFALDRFADAEREFRKELAANPGSARTHALLSCVLIELKRYNEAHTEATTAIQLQPELAHAHYALSLALSKQGEPTSARAAIEEALRHAPGNPAYHGWYSQLLGSRGARDEALAAADRGLAIDPDHSHCLRGRALALAQLGRKAESRQTMQHALAALPEDARVHLLLGGSLLEDGDVEAAIKHLQETLRIRPTMHEARQELIRAYRARNPIYRAVVVKGNSNCITMLLRLFAIPAAYGLMRMSAIRYHAVWHNGLTALFALAFVVNMCADPAFNLLVRLDKKARMALSREEIMISSFAGAALAMMAAGAIGAVTAPLPSLFILALAGGWNAIATVYYFNKDDPGATNTRPVTCAMWAVAALDIALALDRREAGGAVLSFAACISFAVSWILAIRCYNQ